MSDTAALPTMNNRVRTLLVVGAWLGMGLATVMPAPAESSDETHPAPSLMISTEYTGRAALRRADDSFAFTAYTFDFEWLVALFEYDHRRYDWRTRGAADDAPWRTLNVLAPGVQYYRTIGEHGGVWAKVRARASYESTLGSRSWTWNPQVLGFRSAWGRWTLYGGAGALYHPVDPVYYPVLGLATTPEDGHGFAGAVGFPETMARYRFNERYAVKADFHWSIRIHELDRDNARAPAGFVRMVDRTPGLYLEYSPTRALTISPGVRRRMGRSITLYDDDQDKLESSRVRGAWTAIVNVEYTF